MRETARLIACVVAGLVGCGGSPPPECRPQNAACSSSIDCCGGFICSSVFTCLPATGRATGQPCVADGECASAACDPQTGCANANGCPVNAPIACLGALSGSCCDRAHPYCCAVDKFCHVSAADCMAPTCAGKACTNSTSCCAGYTCSRFTRKCVVAKNLGADEPCTSPSQCASGRCDGWCLQPCITDNDCQNSVGYCVQSVGDGNVCFPWCGNGSNTACSVYGAGTTCQSGVDINGGAILICGG